MFNRSSRSALVCGRLLIRYVYFIKANISSVLMPLLADISLRISRFVAVRPSSVVSGAPKKLNAQHKSCPLRDPLADVATPAAIRWLQGLMTAH